MMNQPNNLIIYPRVSKNIHFQLPPSHPPSTRRNGPTCCLASLASNQKTHTLCLLCSTLIDTCDSQRQKSDFNIQTCEYSLNSQ